MNASGGKNPNEDNPNPFRSNNQQKGKGRQKISMKKIENESNLLTTFSKRRAGLFKKASELSTLCGAESAMVIFSPSERSHSYGSPNVETIANRFLNTNIGHIPSNNTLLSAHHEASNRQLTQQLVRMEGLLEHENQRKKELNDMFQPRINEMNYEQLNQLQGRVSGFKSIVESRCKDTTRLGGPTNIHWANPEQGGPSNVGFTNPGGFNTTGYPNAGNPTHLAGGLGSYYLTQNPYGASGSSNGAGGSNFLIPYNFNNQLGGEDTSETETDDEN